MAIRAFGEKKAPSEWAADERCVVSSGVLRRRIGAGWDPEEAITTPFNGAAWQSAKQATLEEDRAKSAQRVYTPPQQEKPKKKRPAVRGQIRPVPTPTAGWEDTAPSTRQPSTQRSSSVRTVRGGLPSLGKRR